MRPTLPVLLLTSLVPSLALTDAVIPLSGYERAPLLKSGDPIIEFEFFYDQAALDELGLAGLMARAESHTTAMNETILESGGAFFLDKEVRLLQLTALPSDLVLPTDGSQALFEFITAAEPLRDPQADFVLGISGTANAANATQFGGLPIWSYALIATSTPPVIAAHEWGHIMDGTHTEAVCWDDELGLLHATLMVGSGTECVGGSGVNIVKRFSYVNRMRVEAAWYTVASFGQSARCSTSICLDDVSGLVVPGFVVDVLDQTGPTTFAAIRNTSDQVVTATIAYHAEEVLETPVWTEDVALQPHATVTWNVRAKLSHLEALPVVDGQVRGLVIITEAGETDAPHLVGDYFLVDDARDFASGSRLGSKRRTEFCNVEEVRFVEFGSGVTFRIVLDEPASFTYSAYDESGTVLVEDATYATSSHLNLLGLDDLVTEANFGTLVFDFSGSGGGTVTAKYEAFGKYSVSMPGACRD